MDELFDTGKKKTGWALAVSFMEADVLDTPEFKAAWKDWLRNWSERRKPLTPLRTKRHILSLETMGHDAAIEAIGNAIDAGWARPYPPDGDGPRRKPVVIPQVKLEPLE